VGGTKCFLDRAACPYPHNLKDYGDYFRNPGHADQVAEVLGRRLRFPQLAVLIGRLRES
jgi:hypothetical protein